MLQGLLLETYFSLTHFYTFQKFYAVDSKLKLSTSPNNSLSKTVIKSEIQFQ